MTLTTLLEISQQSRDQHALLTKLFGAVQADSVLLKALSIMATVYLPASLIAVSDWNHELRHDRGTDDDLERILLKSRSDSGNACQRGHSTIQISLVASVLDLYCRVAASDVPNTAVGGIPESTIASKGGFTYQGQRPP